MSVAALWVLCSGLAFMSPSTACLHLGVLTPSDDGVGR